MGAQVVGQVDDVPFAVVLGLDEVGVLYHAYEGDRAVRDVEPVYMRERAVKDEDDQHSDHILHVGQPGQVFVGKGRHEPWKDVGLCRSDDGVKLLRGRIVTVDSRLNPNGSLVLHDDAAHGRRGVYLASLLRDAPGKDVEDFPKASGWIAQHLSRQPLLPRRKPGVNLGPHPGHPDPVEVVLAELTPEHRPPENLVGAPARFTPQPLVGGHALKGAPVLYAADEQRHQPEA